MEYPHTEAIPANQEPITPEEYQELLLERGQLAVQLSAATENNLPSDVITGIQERMADVERYISDYESSARQMETTEPVPSTDHNPQGELDLVIDRMEMDEGRFTGPGSDSPAFLRKE